MKPKEPWYADIYRQSAVLDRYADRIADRPDRCELRKQAQEKTWSRFDAYMLRKSTEG